MYSFSYIFLIEHSSFFQSHVFRTLPLYSPSPALLKWSPYISFIQPFAIFCKNRCVHSLLHAIIGRISTLHLMSCSTVSHQQLRESVNQTEEENLLKWGLERCNIESVDNDGMTPLNFAAKLGLYSSFFLV